MWGDSAGSEDTGDGKEPCGVAELGSAHWDGIGDRQVGEEDGTPRVGWAAGRVAGTEGQDGITPHLPLQQHGPPTTAREGSTKGGGEGLQSLYSSHNEQA